MTTLFLHCGVHRTGTTLIQTYLAQKRAHFAKQGLIYPFEEDNHQSIVNGLKTRKLPPSDLVARLKGVAAGGASSILLSGEDFCSISNAAWLTPLTEHFDVKIIFYLRRQDLWINSWYNQHVKWPWSYELHTLDHVSFLSHIDKFFWIDYRATLDKWAKAIGKQNLLLGVVERAQVNDIIPDMLAKMGLPTSDLPPYGDANKNNSVSPLAIEALRHGRILDLPVGRRHALVASVAKYAEALSPNMETMVYTPQQRRAILARFADSNEYVARAYFGRADGRLFRDPDVADDAPYAVVPADLAEDLVRTVVEPYVAAHRPAHRPAGKAVLGGLANAPTLSGPPPVSTQGTHAASAKSLVPAGPALLAPYDLSHVGDPTLQARMQKLSAAYLENLVQQGVQGDFDSRFHKATTFLLPFLAKNLPRRPRNVLEIGCGKGAKSLALSLLCDHYVGLDIVRDEIDYARDAARKVGVNNITFSVDEAANIGKFLSASQEKFDLIVLYAVLEHLTPEEKLDMLRVIWDYLDEDGLLYIGEAPNRMHAVDYHSTKSLYFQQMPFDMWPKYLDRVTNTHWRELMGRALAHGDWRKTAKRHGVHVGHQEFDLALMEIEALDRHIVADNYDVNILNLYPLELFEVLKLAELRSFSAFPAGVQIQPRRFPDFFSRYYLEALFSKRPVRGAVKPVMVDWPYVGSTVDLFSENRFVSITADKPFTYRSHSGGAIASVVTQIFEPMRAGPLQVRDAHGKVVASFEPKDVALGFARWRRHLAVELPRVGKADFPLRFEAVDPARPVLLTGIVERPLQD